MSALARYFRHLGKNVAGYDRVRSSLCESLEEEGIAIHYEDDVQQISQKHKEPRSTLVIYTPAVPADHSELNFFKQEGYALMKRAQVLGAISRAHQCLAVAGTHGKTTTSALLAHLFKNAGRDITAFLGGIAVNYHSNFLAGDADGILVAEADEYDRSFLNLEPAGAIITSTDSDHLDIYGTADELRSTFGRFAKVVQGPVVAHKRTGMEGLTYAVDEAADFEARNIRIEDHSYVFDIITNHGENIETIRTGLPGRHNVENALAAAALGLQFGLSAEDIRQGIASFKGVKRRFEYHIKTDELVYIDDYAHHPEEIKALVKSVRELYPGKKITGIFQPHLYSRTRDYADEFGEALSLVDHLILMDIYPAREKPIEGVDAAMLLEKVKLDKKEILKAEDIPAHISGEKNVVILSIGAGDIDRLVKPIKEALER